MLSAARARASSSGRALRRQCRSDCWAVVTPAFEDVDINVQYKSDNHRVEGRARENRSTEANAVDMEDNQSDTISR